MLKKKREGSKGRESQEPNWLIRKCCIEGVIGEGGDGKEGPIRTSSIFRWEVTPTPKPPRGEPVGERKGASVT